ncbi:repressor LexA [Lachnospiraceae bacterium PFB1-21]
MSAPIKEIKDRIKEGLDMRKLSPAELSEKTGIPKSSISQYMNGVVKPKQDRIFLISKALNVSEAWLMGFDIITSRNNKYTFRDTTDTHAVKIKVLGKVAAGIPIEAIEDFIGEEEITMEMANTGSYFGLKIQGDSMEPRILDGDVVIVRQQSDVESGETAIVYVNGHDATCKRIRKYHEGIELIANNPKYEPKYYTNEEIEKIPVRIIGKVVELRGKF